MSPDELDKLLESAHEAADEERSVAAAELFAAYVRQRAEDGRAWHRYGYILRVLGLRDEALHALQKAQELRKGHPNINVQLGMLFTARGDLAASEREFAEACRAYGDEAPGWLWVLRGGNLAVMGQMEAAEAAHRTALGCDFVDHDEAWLNLGYVLRAQGRYGEALQAFQNARELEPADAEILEAIRSLDGIDDAMRRVREAGE